MSASLPPSLLALSPGTLTPERAPAFVAALARAHDAGLPAVLLREPELADRALLALALAARARAGLYVILHDRVHLARLADAHAVQLGFRSLPPRAARALLPESIAIGFSAHAHDAPSARDAADFLLLGPVFDTPSKRGLVDALGLEGFARACAAEARPVWALGGVTPEHAGALRAAGAHGWAALGGIFGAPDPAQAVARYREAWERAR